VAKKKGSFGYILLDTFDKDIDDDINVKALKN